MGGCVSRGWLSRSSAWVSPLTVLASLLVAASFLPAQQIPSSAPEPLRRIPDRAAANLVAVQGMIRDQFGRVVVGAQVEFRGADGIYTAWSDAEGIFRLRDVRLGS